MRRSSWPAEREHGVDEIVPRALLAELDLQAIGEEGQQIDLRVSMLPDQSHFGRHHLGSINASQWRGAVKLSFRALNIGANVQSRDA